MIFINKNKKSGFTLVEMLVSIAVFMSVMVIAIGALLSVINANRKAQAIKSVVDNVNFVVDSITRNIELGDNYKCGSILSNAFTIYSDNNNCPGGGTAFEFLDKSRNGGTLVQYNFVPTSEELKSSGNGNIQQRVCSTAGESCINWSLSSWQNLTGPVSNVNITNMKFYVLGTGTNIPSIVSPDKRQPRVIITIEGSSGLGSSESDFILQTSVSKIGRDD